MLQDMAQKEKDLAITRNSDEETALHVMARKPIAIPRKRQLAGK